MTLGKKSVKNVVKLLQNQPGLKDTQGVNTKSEEKPAQNVTKLFQSRPGLRDTQAVDTKSGKKRVQNVTKLTYEDIKQRIPQEMSLR